MYSYKLLFITCLFIISSNTHTQRDSTIRSNAENYLNVFIIIIIIIAIFSRKLLTGLVWSGSFVIKASSASTTYFSIPYFRAKQFMMQSHEAEERSMISWSMMMMVMRMASILVAPISGYQGEDHWIATSPASAKALAMMLMWKQLWMLRRLLTMLILENLYTLLVRTLSSFLDLLETHTRPDPSDVYDKWELCITQVFLCAIISLI